MNPIALLRPFDGFLEEAQASEAPFGPSERTPHFFSGRYVRGVCQDGDRLCVAGEFGLARVHLDSGEIDRFDFANLLP
ncbi:MAG: hypothetical protein FJX76_00185 [Armatimonadetes bacterium]|nr:hypothetical protein [Armatimonadota bacterium]